MQSVPLWVRKFAVDFIETALALVLALNLAFPTDVASAQQLALVVGSAVLSALVSAVRRAAPAFIAWLAARLGTGDAAP